MTILLAAIVIALPVSLFVLWPVLGRRDEAAARAVDDERTALEAGKGLALRALRELAFDHQSGHMAADDYAELRARYEGRVAVILKRLDELPPPRVAREPAPTPPAVAAAPGPWTRRPAVLGGAAVGLVVFGVVLGVLVVRFTAPAPPEAGMADAGPGMADAGPMTPMAGVGSAGPGAPGPGGGARPIPPGMLQGMLQAARQSLEAGRVQEAIAAYQAILKRDPGNVDALTHFGLILAMAGHADRALEHFERALAIDADYPEALSYSGQVRFEMKQDYAGAIAAWERFARVVSNGGARDEAQARIRDARARLAAGPPGPAAAPAPRP